MTRTADTAADLLMTIRTCKVGRGNNSHAITVHDGETRFPVCGQPRKGIHAVHSVTGTATDGTVTCPKCRARLTAMYTGGVRW